MPRSWKFSAYLSLLCLALATVFLGIQNLPKTWSFYVRSTLLATETPYVDTSLLLKGVTNASLCELKKESAVPKCDGGGGAADKMRLVRDLLQDYGRPDGASDWYGGAFKTNPVKSEEFPHVAHYVWCGEKFFRFEDYLGILSIVRVLRPFKLTFHYSKLPIERDLYHTWFQELKQSIPYLVLKNTNRSIACGTAEALNYALEQLAANPQGGVFIGERTALTHIPDQWRTEEFTTHVIPASARNEEMIVFTKRGLRPGASLELYKKETLKKAFPCMTLDAFNAALNAGKSNQHISEVISPCLAIPSPLFPENIVSDKKPFGRLARFLYYGRPEPIQAKQGQDLIPPFSHMIMLNPTKDKPVEISFSHYLGILSSLYLGGFQRVFIHGDTVPSGDWWNRLANENVTFVYIEEVETVFQQNVKVFAHQSDILRSLILLKYGGAYQDKDAFWSSPVPEDVRRYPALACYDWVDRGEWPRSFNMGVMMAKPGAPFLRKFLDSFWYQWDASWIFNGVLMPYKVYERNPDTLYIYTHLQTICYLDVCHPVWYDDYMIPENQATRPTRPFNNNETSALHYTHPKPDSLLTSFEAIERGTSPLHVLVKSLMSAIVESGKKHLLPGANLTMY